MPSRSKLGFDGNKKDIEILWHIHREFAKPGRKRNQHVDVLTRSAVVFISACWESYIEDLAVEAFDYLLNTCSTPDVFPARVRTVASRELRESKDERKIWDLAGEGWKDVLQAHRDSIKDRWLKDFNSPKSRQVRDLFAGLVDIPDVTSAWCLDGMSSECAADKLDAFITIRGNIAHRIRDDKMVYKSSAKSFLSHITKIVDRTDAKVGLHLTNLTQLSPW